MINFDALPQTRPEGGSGDYGLLPAGTYVATIKKAEVKKSKTGNDYLSVGFSCFGTDNREYYVWDTLVDSDKAFPQFKLGQFLRALPNSLSGNLTFQDIAKICINKQMRIAVKVDKPEGYKERNAIDANDTSMYYKLEAAPMTPLAEDDGDLPFDMGDNEY